MPSVTYCFAAFGRDLLHPMTEPLAEPPLESTQELPDFEGQTPQVSQVLVFESDPLVLRITRQSPLEVAAFRPTLVTRGFAIAGVSHDAFNPFQIIHDDVRYIYAYPRSTDGEASDSEKEIRQGYVKPVRFVAYELDDQWGHLYATAPESILKEMFRRYRGTPGNAGASLMRRKINLRQLRARLREEMGVESSDLTFLNVDGDRALTKIVVAGQQLDDNEEIDDFDTRAEEVGVFTFKYQHENAIIKITIKMSGAVRFANDPEGTSSLDLLQRLDGYIRAHSELVPVSVR